MMVGFKARLRVADLFVVGLKAKVTIVHLFVVVGLSFWWLRPELGLSTSRNNHATITQRSWSARGTPMPLHASPCLSCLMSRPCLLLCAVFSEGVFARRLLHDLVMVQLCPKCKEDDHMRKPALTTTRRCAVRTILQVQVVQNALREP